MLREMLQSQFIGYLLRNAPESATPDIILSKIYTLTVCSVFLELSLRQRFTIQNKDIEKYKQTARTTVNMIKENIVRK